MSKKKQTTLRSQMFYLLLSSLFFELILVIVIATIIGFFVYDKNATNIVSNDLSHVNISEVSNTNNLYVFNKDIVIVDNNNTVKKYLDSYEYDETKLDEILSDVVNSKYEAGKVYTDEYIYFGYVTDGDTKVICLRNSKQDSILMIEIVISAVLAIIICSACGYILVLQIINKPINRLQDLTEFITEMPENSYEKEYIDMGNDEIGLLARAINALRESFLFLEKRKIEIIQNVGHDLKTPVAVIKTYSEAIEDQLEPLESNAIIQEQCAKLQKKIEQLLIFNKVEYIPKDKLHPVAMKPLIEDMVNNYKHINKTMFEVDLEDVSFNGLEENYQIVLSNIIENGLRYAKKCMKITLRENYLAIYNDGPQIDEYFIENGFKAYEKGKGGKFGLGMSIVAKTLNTFDMQLSVRNEPEGGVSFLITK